MTPPFRFRATAGGKQLKPGSLLSEIPLFHVLNARITFSNLCGCDEPVSSVWVPGPSSAISTSGMAIAPGGLGDCSAV